jgi:hypothetical protein
VGAYSCLIIANQWHDDVSYVWLCRTAGLSKCRVWHSTLPCVHPRRYPSVLRITSYPCPSERNNSAGFVGKEAYKYYLYCLSWYHLTQRYRMIMAVSMKCGQPLITHAVLKVLTTLAVRSSIVCDVRPYSPVKVGGCFRGTCRVHLPNWRIGQ